MTVSSVAGPGARAIRGRAQRQCGMPAALTNGHDATVASTVILLGPPGSGKGTQAERLRDASGFEALSTGDLLREARRTGSELGRRAAEYMDRGDLVPDELLFAAVEHAIAGLGRRHVVLDGFPHTVAQACALDRALGEHGRALDSAILIELPDEEVARRIVNRHQGRADDTAETAGERLRLYHWETEPPAAFYEERGLLHRIDGARDADAVEDDVRAALR